MDDDNSATMGPAQRVPQLIRGLAGVLPRTISTLGGSPGWSAASVTGLRQFGEVAFDEFVLTGMTLLSPAPALQRPLSACAPAAEELSALGIDRAHTEPQPLQVKELRRQQFAGLTYESLIFDHDPVLPASLEAEHLSGSATAAVHLFRHRDTPRPWLVWVHGAGQGSSSDFLVARAQRLHHKLGLNIALPVQPGHGVRRRAWPAYPGLDPLANIAGMMRSISEVRAVLRWVQPQATTVTVSGVSLGSPVAALVSHLEPDVDAVAVYTPIAGLNTMIGRHLWRWGPAARPVREALRSEVAAALMTVVDPLATEPAPPADRRLIVAARHDRMAFTEPAVALHDRWGGQLHWHDGSHAGHIFSPGVQAATEAFLGQGTGQ